MSDSRVTYAGDGPLRPPSISSDDSLLSVANRADLGSGISLCGAKMGDLAGLSPRVGVARPLRGVEELEKLREWPGDGFRGTWCRG
jgi:hypothetical protein